MDATYTKCPASYTIRNIRFMVYGIQPVPISIGGDSYRLEEKLFSGKTAI